ncbi:hypothetical protein ACP275_03G004600 [Erythranthe tilingii]
MDSLDPAKVKKITWKRSKTQVENANHEAAEGEKRPHCDDSLQVSTPPIACNLAQSYVMPMLPMPKMDEWCLKKSICFGGTACRGVTAPPVGVVDIGVSKNAYYFCIALPGVKKDPGEFSCEIRREGKVYIQGVTTTGGNTVSKYSRVFVMKMQQQCPPGPFTLLFSLPGPVDPRLFSPTFRSDGIFEGVVAKYDH